MAQIQFTNSTGIGNDEFATAGGGAKTQAPTFLTERETAEFLRVSVRTVQRWRVTGAGPPFRAHGRRILYAASDLENWSASRTARSTSERDAARAAPR